MRRGLVLFAALAAALCLAGCGEGAEQPPAATPEPGFYAAGNEAADQGDYDAAVEAFSQAIEAGENRAAAYAGRADSYMALAGEETEDGPDMRGLALRDYEIALALDSSLGGHIYEVYMGLADEAGSTDETLSYLRTALSAAPEGDEEDVLARAKELTDGLLAASVWYMDAPDSRYYLFDGAGAGRVIDPVAMTGGETFSYENEGFALHIALDGGAALDWTYDPDRPGYCVDGEADVWLEETGLRRACEQWQASMLAAEADGQGTWTDDAAWAAGYESLYEGAYGLLETVAEAAAGSLTEEDNAALAAVRAAHDAPEAGLQERYEQAKQLAAVLLERLPEEKRPDPALDELFPVGEKVLLNYFRHLTNWTLDGAGLSVAGDGKNFGQWKKLDAVEHYFRDGRLYLCLPGYVLRGTVLEENAQGRFVIRTPLTLGADTDIPAEDLPGYLSAQRWTCLTDMGYSTEVFALELDFEEDMTCSARGGYFPEEPTGQQAGQYALDGRELTITMTAEGYVTGTYRYELVPMGESLYMTLLTDGIVYGQTAGSTYVFCGGDYIAGTAGYLG